MSQERLESQINVIHCLGIVSEIKPFVVLLGSLINEPSYSWAGVYALVIML